MYSLTQGEVEAGPSNSVSGQLFISNLYLYTLIDLGATYSYIASSLRIQKYVLYANLMEIDMSDYDIILGKDWLSTHHALINCRRKRLHLNPLQAKSFEF